MALQKIPVCKGLIKPILLFGVDKMAVVLNGAIMFILVVNFRLYYMAIVGVIVHIVLFQISKKDPLIVTIFFARYLKQEDYYFEG